MGLFNRFKSVFACFYDSCSTVRAALICFTASLFLVINVCISRHHLPCDPTTCQLCAVQPVVSLQVQVQVHVPACCDQGQSGT